MENEFYNNTFASSDSAYAPSSSYLVHYGIPKKSGRYPWGSGKRPFQGDGEVAPSNRVNPRDVKKNMDSMSDAELQKAINRINMQRQVESMNPSYFERGRRVVSQYTRDVKLVRDAIGGSMALIATIALLNGVKLK